MGQKIWTLNSQYIEVEITFTKHSIALQELCLDATQSHVWHKGVTCININEIWQDIWQELSLMTAFIALTIPCCANAPTQQHDTKIAAWRHNTAFEMLWIYKGYSGRSDAAYRWAGILGLRALTRQLTYISFTDRSEMKANAIWCEFLAKTRPSIVHFASREKTHRGDSVHEGLDGLIRLAVAHAVAHPHRFLLPASSHSSWAFFTLLATWTNATTG